MTGPVYRGFQALTLVAALAASTGCTQTRDGAPSQKEAETASQSHRFLALSDIHFDPYYDATLVSDLESTPASGWKAIFDRSTDKTLCTLKKDASGHWYCHNRHGQDTNYPLLRASLDAAKAKGGTLDYVLITGDFLAHGFDSKFQSAFPGKQYSDYTEFVKKTMSFLAMELSTAFPSVPIFPALGNNDSNCGDYGVSANSDFLGDVAAIWQPLVGAPLANFSKSGSYTAPHPVVPNLDFVMFNDVPLSKCYPACYGFAYSGSSGSHCGGGLAAAETDWLRTTLSDAQGKVVLAYHIPPGIDQYGTAADYLNQGCNPLKVDFDLQAVEGEAFRTILAGHRDKIQSVFAAHTHMDDFRVFQLTQPTSSLAVRPLPIRVNPSISIHNGNNPGFQIFTYNPADGSLLDYTTYYLSNIGVAGTDNPQGQPIAPDWPELYTYSTDYLAAGGVRATGFDIDAVTQLVDKLGADQAFAQATYWQFHALGGVERGGGNISGADWPVYRCSLNTLTELAFENCVCP